MWIELSGVTGMWQLFSSPGTVLSQIKLVNRLFVLLIKRHLSSALAMKSNSIFLNGDIGPKAEIYMEQPQGLPSTGTVTQAGTASD
jgi:hypothetical protein